MKASKGVVTEIQRWSLNDGEGIRTTVFLKGCPLSCIWCHNPETHKMNPELTYRRDICTLCGKCVEACRQNALKVLGNGILIDRKSCTGCCDCIEICPEQAVSLTGRVMTIAEIMTLIEKDSVFYRSSCGGVTFSGGEPTMQHGFLESLVDECILLGIGTALETSMYFEWEKLEATIEKIDMVFADIKHMDTLEHKKWTGVGNEIILDNIKKASDTGKKIIIRIPLVKGINDTEKNIHAAALFIKDNLSIKGVELLPYHNLGKEKYAFLGREFDGTLEKPPKERIEEIERIFEDNGIEIVSFK